MEPLDNPTLRQHITTFLENQQDALTWVEAHGLFCALAVGPTPDTSWHSLLFLEEPAPIDASVAKAIEQQIARFNSDLGAGDGITLPCRLDPLDEQLDGSNLAAWCTGFMTAVISNDANWHANDTDDELPNLLLPFVAIAELDDDPDLEALRDDERLLRQMAFGIPSLLEEIYLHFHAPDMPKS